MGRVVKSQERRKTMTQVVDITRRLGVVAGMLAALTLAGCGGSQNSGQNQNGLDELNETEGDRDDGMTPSDEHDCDPEDPCAPILERIANETDPWVIEALQQEYD